MNKPIPGEPYLRESLAALIGYCLSALFVIAIAIVLCGIIGMGFVICVKAGTKAGFKPAIYLEERLFEDAEGANADD